EGMADTTQYRVNEAAIEVPGFVTCLLQRFDLPGPGERVWNQPHPCVTLALSPPFRSLESQVTIGGTGPVYPVGDLFFQPAGWPLHYSGTGGKSQTVGCVFNTGGFEQVTGIRPDGSGLDLAVSFDIADTAIHQSMRFLARELDNPGFASITLVEALATAI